MKKSNKKSDRIYPTKNRRENAMSFSKKVLEKMRGMSLRNIDIEYYIQELYRKAEKSKDDTKVTDTLKTFDSDISNLL